MLSETVNIRDNILMKYLFDWRECIGAMVGQWG